MEPAGLDKEGGKRPAYGTALTERKTEKPGDIEKGKMSSVDSTSANACKPNSLALRVIRKSKHLMSATHQSLASLPSTSGDNDTQHLSLSYNYLKTDPAFNPIKVINGRPPAILGAAPNSQVSKDRIKEAAKQTATTIIHPKRAAMDRFECKTAARLSRATRPYISPESDREFLEAHDVLFRMESDRANELRTRTGNWTSENQGSGKDKVGKQDWRETPDAAEIQRRKVEKLEAHRESLRVAWITSRHIKRVHLAPSHISDHPRLDDERFFEEENTESTTRFKWQRYVAHFLLYNCQDFMARYVDESLGELSFDSETLAHYIERLVMATEPWQEWFMEIRRLYRWENPKRTAWWFAVFVVLWYTQHIVGFMSNQLGTRLIEHLIEVRKHIGGVRWSIDMDESAGSNQCLMKLHLIFSFK
ncbi:hypothetical protein VTN00DRAFT_6540 [Thermoascus crustaceus]|uniref:uncharacterized protein n=1 Tax=Thermoascus crustaceus TaxID=5088 RepID=UPI003742658B